MDLWDVCTRAVIDKSFASVRPTSCCAWFGGYRYLTTIEGLEYLNTSEVTNMTYMFGYCPQLTSLDLSNFNTAKVTEMIAMFNGCRALETIYVSDGWTVDNVTESRLMFGQCYSLVGGQGTTYPWDNPNAPDKTYAHIDGGESNPGFLTQLFNIALNENFDDNNATISEYNGKPCKVTLDRTIVPGSYNTLSLPFDVDNVLLKEKFGEDVELAELSGTHMDNETLYFDFAPADAITAGVPYLIYVSNAVESPITFNAVTVKNGTQPVTTSLADFIPVFDVTTLDNGNENILFLGANNTLYYPSASSGAMKGFRAYFEVKGAAQGAKAMVMMDNSLTGVKTILNENLQNEQVYDLQGRMVTRPAKGLYIVNGKKVIIK
ncbi:MAG: BspA family leucine-rich repeat surface protein [Prevotella sp.]|nr:BspA family leucine-rich repeat surface protein [Prevotella sp.]